MSRIIVLVSAFLLHVAPLFAQQIPSYSRDIRPFLAKYCLECHNAKTLKGTLSLDSHKALMDGSDSGPVVKAGKPDESKLVLLAEHKDKPTMPPPKAKFQPTKDEVKLLRVWVLAGAKDDAVSVKVELPVIKAKSVALPPVTAISYGERSKKLWVARKSSLTELKFDEDTVESSERKFGSNITGLIAGSIVSIEEPKGSSVVMLLDATTIYGPGSQVLGRHSETILDLAIGVGPKQGPSVRFASASYDGTINVFDSRLSPVVALKEHSDAVYGLAFNPDGTLLASVSADRALKIWDVEKGKLLYTLGEATDWLYTVAWSPNGKYLVSGGVDKSIRVYESALTPGPSPKGRGEWSGGAKLRQSVFAHEGPVQKVLFSSDSKTLYSVGQDRVIKAWDVEKMVERKVYDKQPETVLCMALREDAGQIIIGRYDGVVQLIDMKTGKVAHEFGKEKAQPKPRDERSDSRGSHSQESLRSSWGLVTTTLIGADNPGRSPETAQPVDLPTQVTGTLDRAGLMHFYRFDIKEDGQPVGLQLQTKELMSKLDPVLVITDLAGRQLAESYDGHLGHTFAKKGRYAVSVRDREFRGGADFKYRLQLGEVKVVNELFPLGAQRGTRAAIQINGVFLPSPAHEIDVPKDAKVGEMIPVPTGNGVLGKAQIVVGEFPEVTKVGNMPVPSTANGRIQKDNQNDLWTFSAKKGQRLVIEVNARRLGSRLDSMIEILDKNDQPVPRAVLRSQAKTHVTFRDHDSAQGNIRIEAWSELGVNDYLFVGNELMKIQALPTHPDADCNFFATQGQRIGYLDTTPTHHANNTPMYKVTKHAPGTSFPPNGFPVFTLHYKNDDGGPGFGRDSRILFDPPADGEYKVRIADARGMGGVNFGYRLTVRQPKEHFTLKATPANPAVSKGSAIPITITAERIDGFEGPITVKVKNLPAGFHMPPTTIEAGTFSTTVPLFADADAKLPAKSLPIYLEGSTHATGLPFSSIREFPMPKLIEPGDLVTTTVESEVAIKAGEQARMTVKIERRNGFKGRVPLEVKGLPHGVRVLDIGLNGILVNENETTRTVVLYAEAWVPAQAHPIVVLAKREGKNTEHAAKAVVLQVK